MDKKMKNTNKHPKKTNKKLNYFFIQVENTHKYTKTQSKH